VVGLLDSTLRRRRPSVRAHGVGQGERVRERESLQRGGVARQHPAPPPPEGASTRCRSGSAGVVKARWVSQSHARQSHALGCHQLPQRSSTSLRLRSRAALGRALASSTEVPTGPLKPNRGSKHTPWAAHAPRDATAALRGTALRQPGRRRRRRAGRRGQRVRHQPQLLLRAQ
jgi:hypothetical protein